jgi:hypothetical protein
MLLAVALSAAQQLDQRLLPAIALLQCLLGQQPQQQLQQAQLVYSKVPAERSSRLQLRLLLLGQLAWAVEHGALQLQVLAVCNLTSRCQPCPVREST